MVDRPSGTVTFLFTNIEGATLGHELADAMRYAQEQIKLARQMVEPRDDDRATHDDA